MIQSIMYSDIGKWVDNVTGETNEGGKIIRRGRIVAYDNTSAKKEAKIVFWDGNEDSPLLLENSHDWKGEKSETLAYESLSFTEEKDVPPWKS